MGGDVFKVDVYSTKPSSVRALAVRRRLLAYVVPQGPRHPIWLPLRDFSGSSLPSDCLYPSVWQSWQPPTIDTRGPRSAEISPAASSEAAMKMVATRVSDAANRAMFI